MKPLVRILYVEDDMDIQFIGKLALQTLGGFVIEVCNDGMEAIEKAPAFQPDLILLDVILPKMNGVETFEKMKSIPQLARVPVVFMTANIGAQDIMSYKKAGAIDVITKPFDPTTLAETVRSIWSRFQDSMGQMLC